MGSSTERLILVLFLSLLLCATFVLVTNNLERRYDLSFYLSFTPRQEENCGVFFDDMVPQREESY